MSDGIIVTVRWTIKPGSIDAFVAALTEMFPVTRTHKGFRSIELLADAADGGNFLLFEAWDRAEDFNAYGDFRSSTGDTARLLEMAVEYPQLTVWDGAPRAAARA